MPVRTAPSQTRVRPPHFWLFQANPNRYRIEDSLHVEQKEEWNLNQHAKDVRLGDRVGIWICGDQAGLYAVGTVLTEPAIRADSETGIEYWTNPQDGRRPKARVTVRYDSVFLDRPLLKVYVESDPALQTLKILHFPRGTNFALTSEEWSALDAWLAELPD